MCETGGFFMIAVRIIRVITGVAGVGALPLGLLFWIAEIDFISLHMLFGLIVALSLLILGIVGVFTRGLRLLGAIGIVYTLIVPAFGLMQATLLVGSLHWLIQTAHLLVGLGALALAGILSTRYLRLKQVTAKGSAVSWLLSLLHKVSTRGKVGLMRANIIYTLGRLFASVRSPFSQSYKINLPCSQVSVNATQARYRTE